MSNVYIILTNHENFNKAYLKWAISLQLLIWEKWEEHIFISNLELQKTGNYFTCKKFCKILPISLIAKVPYSCFRCILWVWVLIFIVRVKVKASPGQFNPCAWQRVVQPPPPLHSFFPSSSNFSKSWNLWIIIFCPLTFWTTLRLIS